MLPKPFGIMPYSTIAAPATASKREETPVVADA